MNNSNDNIDSLKAQAAALMNNNRLEEARTAYYKLVELEPQDANAWYMLSNVNGRLGRIAEVEDCCRRAVALKPEFSEAHVNLGHICLIHGKSQEALAHYQTATRINPSLPDVYYNMGNILREQGNLTEAIENYRKALQYAPTMAAAHNNLGTAYLDQGAFQNAADCFLAALQLDPNSTIYPTNFGMACRNRDQFNIYMEYYRKAVERTPDPRNIRRGFIQILANNNLVDHDEWLDKELQACFSLPDIDCKPLTNDAARLLKNKHEVSKYLGADDNSIGGAIEGIACDKLFILYLEKVLNVDAELEIFLTKVRRSLLIDHRQDKNIDEDHLALIYALACQGANNEYVFYLDADEQHYLDELRDGIERSAPAADGISPGLIRELCLFAMYASLNSLSCRKHLGGIARSAWPEWFLPLLDKTLIFPLEEEAIKPTINSIGMLEDDVSQLVQSQYEENPYPRWLTLPDLMKIDIRHELKQLFPYFNPPAILAGPLEYLVAGCGTGRQPIATALYVDNIEVVAVDISKSSLAYAIRMARKYGVKNIQFLQGDILKLSSLNKHFPLVACSGVLHHMEDPLAGWKVLTDLLMKDGIMSIALYSDIARRDLNAPRDEFKSMSLTPNRKNIVKYRRNIVRRIANGEISPSSMLNGYDFYSTSGCRDLLFHYQEHRFTIPKIRDALLELDLKFIGFILPAARKRDIKNSYLKLFPEDRAMVDLSCWERFEAMYPDTFSEMYQFYCQKN